MTDQDPALQSPTGFDSITDPAILAVAKTIVSTLHLSHDRMRAVMNLPPVNEADNETLALAIQFILGKHFSLTFPAREMMRARRGDDAVIFKEEGQDRDLPARNVAIMLDPSRRNFEVSGVLPENGRDAYSELLFKWRKQAGVVDEHGNIDLKKLNIFPTIQKDKLLARIFSHTQGQAGVDALGKRVKPRAGRPMKVRYNEAVITRRDPPEDSACFHLLAARSGIVDFSLTRKNDPASLQRLDIVDTLTINGDVNYKVGDLGSLTDKDLTGAANIVVNGNVLGVFTLQSEGFIHVRGSIEGKKVVANEVEAEVIGSNTVVLARENLVAGTIIQARISAGVVVLKKGANESVFQVSELMRLEKNCSCLALKIGTRKLEADSARFSGQNIINLGRSLFEEEKEIQDGKKAVDRLLEAELPELRELAKNAISHLANVEALINKSAGGAPPAILQLFGLIKQNLVSTLQQMNSSLNPKLVQACYRLQAMLGEKRFHESVLRKVETMVSALKKLDEKLKEQEKLWNRLTAFENRKKELLQETGELYALFSKPQMAGGSSEIHIVCGEQKMILGPGDIPDEDFRVCYELADNATSLGQGQLEIVESF